MMTDPPDLDSFLEEEFSGTGMRNLYGPDKIEPNFKHERKDRS